MKIRPLILLVFLMLNIALFGIAPMHTGIVTEQNTNKDFALSDYGDISNQSVTSISETLPDNTLHLPDQFTNGTIQLAEGGSDDWDDSLIVDGTYWDAEYDTAEISLFNTTPANVIIEGFEYSFYGYATGGSCYLYYTGTGDTTNLETITVDTTPSWYNGSYIPDPDSADTTNDAYYNIGINPDDVGDTIKCDYLEIRYIVFNTSQYGDSFADLSDWTDETATMTTDEDIMTLEMSGSGWGWQGGAYSNGPSFSSGDWITTELRVGMESVANQSLRLYVYGFSLDDKGGTSYLLGVINGLYLTEGWQTYKASMILAYDLESIRFLFRLNDDYEFYSDYLMISNDTAMFGWEHDGSIISNVNSPTGDTVSSDGDLVILQSGVGDDNSFDFEVDNTTTQSAVDCGYYPFLEIRTTSVSEGDGWKLELFNGSDWTEITEGPYYGWMAYEYGLGTFRYNIETLADEVYTFRVNTTATAEIHIEYIKVYSIANFSLSSGSANTVDDVLYCEDDELYSLTTEGTNRYWTIDYDPTLDIPFTYNNYSLDVSANTQWFAEYIEGDDWQAWKVDEPEGILTKGTVTDFRIMIDGTTKLSSILFIETLSWQSLDGVTFYFVIGSVYGSWTIQALMVFLGLGLIPFSTIFLVYGGRDNLSMDKVFYFSIMFIIGWALVIGGVVS